MIFKNRDLQLAMNFDTYVEPHFDLAERMAMHRSISRMLSHGIGENLPPILSEKLEKLLQTINAISYEPRKGAYYEDKATKEISFRTSRSHI